MKKYKVSYIKRKLGKFIRVNPIYSTRSGDPVRNQYEVVFEHGRIFQSYNSLIGIQVDGKLYLTNYHDYSVTTSKYCSEWCGLGTSDRRKGIEKGEIGYLYY